MEDLLKDFQEFRKDLQVKSESKATSGGGVYVPMWVMSMFGVIMIAILGAAVNTFLDVRDIKSTIYTQVEANRTLLLNEQAHGALRSRIQTLEQIHGLTGSGR